MIKNKAVLKFTLGLMLINSLTACKEENSKNTSNQNEVLTSQYTLASRSVAQEYEIPKDDVPSDPIDCFFDNQLVKDGSAITAFQNSSANYGESCVTESRVCQAGVLTGSYIYASCEVGAAKSCLFDGSSISHGESVTAYQSSTVSYGQLCSTAAETRICNNGVLSGSAVYSKCEIASPRACLFDGKTISHGESIKAFKNSTTRYGSNCEEEVRSCQDGTLTGSYIYGSCAIDQPESCLFAGRTIAHGEKVIGFKTSSVGYGELCSSEERLCQNGVLSGQNGYESCVVGAPNSCELNGVVYQHGESFIAYESAQVKYSNVCQSEARSCNNGVISGSYQYSSCQAEAAKACTFQGESVQHGESVVAYFSENVSSGSRCSSETRKCTDGVLSGSATHKQCVIQEPPVVANPLKSCYLNDQEIKHGSSVTTYKEAHVGYGLNCLSQTRKCNDGVLSGEYTQNNCSVDIAQNCELMVKL